MPRKETSKRNCYTGASSTTPVAGLAPGMAALQEFDLAIVVGLVFGYVKPLGVVVPAKIFVESCEPFVVTLAEFGKILLAGFVKDIQVVVETVALDGFARGVRRDSWGCPIFS